MEPLTYTSELPHLEGYYWHRREDGIVSIGHAFLDEHAEEHEPPAERYYVRFVGDEDSFPVHLEGGEWAGPIPLPLDPAAQETIEEIARRLQAEGAAAEIERRDVKLS